MIGPTSLGRTDPPEISLIVIDASLLDKLSR